MFIVMMSIIMTFISATFPSSNMKATPSCASSLSYWNSYDSLTACLRSNPASDENKLAAIDSLRLAIENYAFVDIIKNPPNKKLAEPVDLEAGLNSVAGAKFASDADLHEVLN